MDVCAPERQEEVLSKIHAVCPAEKSPGCACNGDFSTGLQAFQRHNGAQMNDFIFVQQNVVFKDSENAAKTGGSQQRLKMPLCSIHRSGKVSNDVVDSGLVSQLRLNEEQVDSTGKAAADSLQRLGAESHKSSAISISAAMTPQVPAGKKRCHAEQHADRALENFSQHQKQVKFDFHGAYEAPFPDQVENANEAAEDKCCCSQVLKEARVSRLQFCGHSKQKEPVDYLNYGSPNPMDLKIYHGDVNSLMRCHNEVDGGKKASHLNQREKFLNFTAEGESGSVQWLGAKCARIPQSDPSTESKLTHGTGASLMRCHNEEGADEMASHLKQREKLFNTADEGEPGSAQWLRAESNPTPESKVQFFVDILDRTLSVQRNLNEVTVQELINSSCDVIRVKNPGFHAVIGGKLMPSEDCLLLHPVLRDTTVHVCFRLDGGRQARSFNTVFAVDEEVLFNFVHLPDKLVNPRLIEPDLQVIRWVVKLRFPYRIKVKRVIAGVCYRGLFDGSNIIFYGDEVLFLNVIEHAYDGPGCAADYYSLHLVLAIIRSRDGWFSQYWHQLLGYLVRCPAGFYSNLPPAVFFLVNHPALDFYFDRIKKLQVFANQNFRVESDVLEMFPPDNITPWWDMIRTCPEFERVLNYDADVRYGQTYYNEWYSDDDLGCGLFNNNYLSMQTIL